MTTPNTQTVEAILRLPRVTISYCTQCKWMLRAAYFAQELLSTFGTTLGEVVLIPTMGGTFEIHILHTGGNNVIWDRKTDGGFPEVKELKRRVRDIVEPQRDLGHVDRHGGGASTTTGVTTREVGSAMVDEE